MIQGYEPQGYHPQDSDPHGYHPQGYHPQCYDPQGHVLIQRFWDSATDHALQADADTVMCNIFCNCGCLADDLCCAAGLFHLAMACGSQQRQQHFKDIMGLAEGWKGS